MSGPGHKPKRWPSMFTCVLNDSNERRGAVAECIADRYAARMEPSVEISGCPTTRLRRSCRKSIVLSILRWPTPQLTIAFYRFRFLVRKASLCRPPTKAALLDRDGVHGLLNFVGEPVQVLVQPVVHFAFDPVRSQVADQCGLCGIRAKLSDR